MSDDVFCSERFVIPLPQIEVTLAIAFPGLGVPKQTEGTYIENDFVLTA